jgi:hypothetical protein
MVLMLLPLREFELRKSRAQWSDAIISGGRQACITPGLESFTTRRRGDEGFIEEIESHIAAQIKENI